MSYLYFPRDSHQAVRHAASRLCEEGLATSNTDDLSRAEVVLGTSDALGLALLPGRTFEIFERDGRLWIVGDRARTLLAGALYFIHHRRRGAVPDLPLRRTSPFAGRLILEDFPFHCYQPTGFDFEARLYAENLVALGYTAMECNRLSQGDPSPFYFDGYALTNPSPAAFVWTPWHEGSWTRERVASHAAELRACVQIALDFDLEPSFTTFLPRPYPNSFFERHPHLRGSEFRHQHLINGRHPGQFRINTDESEGIGFYRAVFAGLLDANPELVHFFFWHADLGTGFGPENEVDQEARRISAFHRMLDELMGEKNMASRVWLNPWAMHEGCLEELNQVLPDRVGYAVKDNTGASHYFGTMLSKLPDLTIISPAIGALPRKVQTLAAASGRAVCLCQYQDFSEDLDPIIGVPHPMLTFRKFRSLQEYAPDYSSTNWGVFSPEVTGSLANQAVIREMTWGVEANCFEKLLPLLLPEALPQESGEMVVSAWRKIDGALRMWPQFWGLRLQDGGLRFRWLIKPFLLNQTDISEEEKRYYLDHQIYRIDSLHPFGDFLNLDLAQAAEVACLYSEMICLVEEAESLMEAARAIEGTSIEIADWIASQLVPVKWLRFFWTTYYHLFRFHGLAREGGLTKEHCLWMEMEIRNTEEILQHLQAHPMSLVIAKNGKWGQCFGPDIADDFSRKLKVLKELLGQQGTMSVPSAYVP